jgi:hypothetical protein
MKIAQQPRWAHTSVPAKETYQKMGSWRTRQEDTIKGKTIIDLVIT